MGRGLIGCEEAGEENRVQSKEIATAKSERVRVAGDLLKKIYAVDTESSPVVPCGLASISPFLCFLISALVAVTFTVSSVQESSSGFNGGMDSEDFGMRLSMTP